MIKAEGHHEGNHEEKSPTEGYVEIKECKCQECDSWELDYDVKDDEGNPTGRCGLEDSLSFVSRVDPVEEEEGPKCLIFENQVGTPPWATNVPDQDS